MSRSFGQQLWDYPIAPYDATNTVAIAAPATTATAAATAPPFSREITPVTTPRIQPTSSARHSEFIAHTIGADTSTARVLGVVTPQGRYVHPLAVPSHTILETTEHKHPATGQVVKRTVHAAPESITVRVPVSLQRKPSGQYEVIEQDWRALSQPRLSQQQQLQQLQQQVDVDDEHIQAWRLDTLQRVPEATEEKTLESDPSRLREQAARASSSSSAAAAATLGDHDNGPSAHHNTAHQRIPAHPSHFPDLGLFLEDVHTRHTATTGVGVRRVTSGSVAALCGLKVQDHIVALQGETVLNVADFRRKLDKISGTFWVSLNRDGRRNITISVVRM